MGNEIRKPPVNPRRIPIPPLKPENTGIPIAPISR
jgi:hypothetical protein